MKRKHPMQKLSRTGGFDPTTLQLNSSSQAPCAQPTINAKTPRIVSRLSGLKPSGTAYYEEAEFCCCVRNMLVVYLLLRVLNMSQAARNLETTALVGRINRTIQRDWLCYVFDSTVCLLE
jgi:hypothetical protein